MTVLMLSVWRQPLCHQPWVQRQLMSSWISLTRKYECILYGALVKVRKTLRKQKAPWRMVKVLKRQCRKTGTQIEKNYFTTVPEIQYDLYRQSLCSFELCYAELDSYISLMLTIHCVILGCPRWKMTNVKDTWLQNSGPSKKMATYYLKRKSLKTSNHQWQKEEHLIDVWI